MKKVLLVLLVLAMVASIFAGCTPEPVEVEATEEPTEEVVVTEEPDEEVVEEVVDEPSVFNWNIGADPKTIDPGLNGASDGGNVINQTFEGLVREKSGTVLPGIAKDWETSADGLTVTFNLRESTWSDGSPLTAHDFVYSWLRAMAPATASEYSWLWHYTNVVGAEDYVSTSAISGLEAAIEAGVGGVVDEEAEELEYYTQEDIDTATADLAELQMYTPDTVGIRAVDDLTFEVTLTDPTDYFVSLMAFYHFMPVKQSSVEAAGGEEGTWASNPDLAVSNGPFVLTDYRIGDGLVLEKNENYWSADTVGIDIINGAFIDDQNTSFAAYNNGELDLLNTVPTAEIPRLMAEDPNFYVFPLLGTYYYNFNMDLEIWSDVRVRKALSMAIDREKITEVLASGQVPAGGFVPPGFLDNEGRDFFATAGMYGLSIDDGSVADAQALLAEAGYPGGEGFPEFVMLYNTSEGHQTIAELIQEMFKTNLGIECTLENQEWAVFQDTRTQGNYELARGGWLTDFMDPSGMLGIFVPGNAYNDPNYDNADFQAALIAASETTDPAVHFEKLYEAQDIFMNDMPIIPIYHYSATILARETLVDWDRSVLGTLDFSSAYME
ncbi:MAG: peptide ABC transporter substrate-binding protein [Clostridia bacterium]|nr:peptide ABC transporter substrate-binding protein [Clostridia bacterium]MBT7121433.1 peptide ABC transporter substrate-binding protein [Clostridia bacterium]